MKTQDVARQFVAAVRASFPNQLEALPEGKALFEKQDFDRRLSIAATAKAVLRTCAVWVNEPQRMKTLFKPSILHFQHLHCMDTILEYVPPVWNNLLQEKPESLATATPEQQILMLQIALLQAEMACDFKFKFCRPDPAAGGA